MLGVLYPYVWQPPLASSISTYNTQWRGLAELLILNEWQCEGRDDGISDGKFTPTSFLFPQINLIINPLRQGERQAKGKLMQKTICNIKDTIRQNKFLRCNGWGLLAILAFILCINIEFKWLLIPLLCDNAANANAVNKIILALSYSYIAAAIFHWVVNVLPHKKRKKNIYPF